MPRPRKRPLPPGIRERRYRSGTRAYWIDFRTETGERVQEKGGDTIEDAMRLLRQRKAAVAAGTYLRGDGTGEQTIATYAARWIELRKREGVRSVDRDADLLRLQVLPYLGSVRLSDLRPRDVASWVRTLGREGTLAPKTIRNAHGALSSMLTRARFDDLIADNPARGLPRGMLPKNTRSREVGAWTRAELVTLMSDERIPEDRRVAYAVAAFTGARVGEIAGMRWRDLDTEARPLWRWALRTQYDGAPLKTDHPRDVPIHPELQRVLAAWKLGGWSRFMCKAGPGPEDFVIPRAPLRSRKGHAKRTAYHSDQSLGAKAVQAHALRADLDPTGRDFHSFRRAMITLARTDGARAEILERVTHNAAGAMIDAYTYFGWPELCSAVECIRLAPRRAARVVALRRAGGDARGDASLSSGENVSDIAYVEASPAGFEPDESKGVDGAFACLGVTGASMADARIPTDPSVFPAVVTRVTSVTAQAVEALRALLPGASDPAERQRLERALAVLEGDLAVPTE